MTAMTETETEASGNGAGKSIDDMAAEGQQEIDGMPPVEGVQEQLSLNAGGSKPTTATMTLQGGAVPVEGQFQKGEVVRFYVEARVASVTFADKWDSKLMAVVSTDRKHTAKVVGIRRVE